MTASYLEDPALEVRARALLKRARSRDALLGAVYAARRGELRELGAHAWAGIRYDPLWAVRFAARTARLLAGARAEVIP